MSFCKISGTAIDKKTYKEYLTLSSSSSLSSGFNLSWSINTNTFEDCIIYNNYKFTYDQILKLLDK